MGWTWAGDRALLRTFDDGDLAAANRRALTLHRFVRAHGLLEVEDSIPGARSLLVMLRPGMEPSEVLRTALEAEVFPSASSAGDEHEIRVVYDGEDLADVASLHGMSTDDVVDLHSSAEYTVGFLGFSPGFAYLIGLPPSLHTQRLPTPRTRIAAGSVGIGGEFTGVYPRPTPGGWRLIGRAGLTLFDPAHEPPAMLRPGDRVRFVPA